MEISYQISWERSSYYCSYTQIANSYVITSSSRYEISCLYGCSGDIISPISYVCTYFSAEDGWTFGEYNISYTFNNVSDENTITIGTAINQCCWIDEVGDGYWNISTTFSLIKRADIGRINSSPRVLPTLPLRLQEGCSYTIPIPVSDPDNDTVRCRWAVGRECISVCNQLTGALLDSNTCTISYTANNGTGMKAVAIMIEDYAPGSPHHSLSSVALQFLIIGYSSNQSCSSQAEVSRFPSVTLHPSNKTVFWKQSLNLALTCMTNETASYYWERQNGHVPFTAIGMHTNTLTLTNVQPEDAGSYRCVAFVCSICTQSFSNYAVITVKGTYLS